MSAAENTPFGGHPPRWKTLLAFGFIYFVWGSTYLAIRVGVHEIPPLMMAAMRFFAAGGALYIVSPKGSETTDAAYLQADSSVVALLSKHSTLHPTNVIASA